MTATTINRPRTGTDDVPVHSTTLAGLLAVHRRAGLTAAAVDDSGGQLVTQVAEEARAAHVLLSPPTQTPVSPPPPPGAPLVVRQRDLGRAQARLLALPGGQGRSQEEIRYISEATRRVEALAQALERTVRP